MRKNTMMKLTLIPLIIGLILPVFNQAQEQWDVNGTPYYYPTGYYPSGDGRYDYYGEPETYTQIDYSYNSPRYYGHMDGGYRDAHGMIRFGRRIDISDDTFSAGISSYQGTSTGPGPNGGYPGAPRGIYPTNYVNTSIYPNTYMKIQR